MSTDDPNEQPFEEFVTETLLAQAAVNGLFVKFIEESSAANREKFQIAVDMLVADFDLKGERRLADRFLQLVCKARTKSPTRPAPQRH